jgi:hypothetical protein
LGDIIKGELQVLEIHLFIKYLKFDTPPLLNYTGLYGKLQATSTPDHKRPIILADQLYAAHASPLADSLAYAESTSGYPGSFSANTFT